MIGIKKWKWSKFPDKKEVIASGCPERDFFLFIICDADFF